jgi:tetratricopeptide (TPR) repeat protein
LSVFSFIELRGGKNRLEQLVDEDFVYHEYRCESERERTLLTCKWIFGVIGNQELRLKVYQNLAICYIRMQMNSDAIKACDHALGIDPNSIKAFYRRAKVCKGVDCW